MEPVIRAVRHFSSVANVEGNSAYQIRNSLGVGCEGCLGTSESSDRFMGVFVASKRGGLRRRH